MFYKKKIISLSVFYVWLYANVEQPYGATHRTLEFICTAMFCENAYFLHLEHVSGEEILCSILII